MEHRPLSKVGKLGGKNSLDVLWLSGDEEAELAREANLDCVRRLGGSDAEKSVESLEELVPELITSNPQENRNGFALISYLLSNAGRGTLSLLPVKGLEAMTGALIPPDLLRRYSILTLKNTRSRR